MTQLVLSIFPGIDLLGRAFEEAGYCVVRGPDVLWGGDVRRFHPPVERFDGVIGGPPCQCFSSLARLVRHNGFETKFGNLIPEFERVISEAAPLWFLMEEVPASPAPAVDGYGVHSFILNNRQFGESQNRSRRISFGWRGVRLVLEIDVVALENPQWDHAATGAGRRMVPVAIGDPGSGKPKRNKAGRIAAYDYLGASTRRSAAGFAAVKALQGLPEDFDLPGFLVEAKVQAVANGVPMTMGQALATAVAEVIEKTAPARKHTQCHAQRETISSP